MQRAIKIGICFGITSGIITTLGLMVGLTSGTQSKLVVIGGILTIAIADAFSDALGIHISEESGKNKTHAEVWMATIATFLAKFLFALTFAIPVFLLELDMAVWVSVAWGLFAMIVLNFYLAKEQKESPWGPIAEHLFITILVITITYFLGEWIARTFV